MELQVTEKLRPQLTGKISASLDFFTCRDPTKAGLSTTPEAVIQRCFAERPNPETNMGVEEYADFFGIRELLIPYIAAARRAGMLQPHHKSTVGRKGPHPVPDGVSLPNFEAPAAAPSASPRRDDRPGQDGKVSDEDAFMSLTETVIGRIKSVAEKPDVGTVDPRPKKPVAVPWEDAPLSFNPAVDIVFGCSDLAPLEKELFQVIVVENKTETNINCWISKPKMEIPRFSLDMDANKFVIAPRERVKITLKLVLHCTMDLELRIPVHMWEKDAEFYFRSDLLGYVSGEPSTHLDPNEIITGDEIGHGAFGVVYSGVYRGIDAAVKVVKMSDNLSKEEVTDAFRREVRNLECLRHPAIVHFIGSINIGPIMAIVTELCPYGSLQSSLEKYPTLSLLFRLKALLDISDAMQFIHNNHFIHRDLKTENALVCSLEVGDDPVSMSPIVKLADFGTTRGLGSLIGTEQMVLSSNVGTPIFMAPEILRNSTDYTPSVDVYSFGIVIAHVLSGYVPYIKPKRMFKSRPEFEERVMKGTLRPEFPANASPFMRRLMTFCWDNDPRRRPIFFKISEALKHEISEIVSKQS